MTPLGRIPFVELLHFVVNALQHRVGVVALLQQHDPFNGVGIVDDLPSGRWMALPIWPRRILGPCATVAISLILMAVPFAVLTTVFSMSCTLVKRPSDCTLICCAPCFDEAAAAVGVVAGDLLLDLADGQAVGDQLLRIELDLVFLGRSAEAGNIHHAVHALEGLLQRPVFERLLLHHVVGGVGALQRVPVDLADGAPVGSHLRNKIGGQVHLTEPLQHVLAIHVAG